ncbi:SENSITIVE TO UV 2-like protein [Drosera capensis]
MLKSLILLCHRFGGTAVLEAVDVLLKKEAGLRLKLLAAFCSGFNDSNSAGAPNAGANTASASLFFGILDGLRMCISCCRNNAQGKLALIHKLPNRAIFLGLILRVLVSEVDAESSANCTEPAVSRERTLLMREALILLNRLASHPTYAPAVLKVLTSYGDMASLSIDIANRLSKRNNKFGQKCNDVTKQMREFEIVDLARGSSAAEKELPKRYS